MRTYVFGPVPSRRLGISLGVDLTPTKTCSYDCLYCQLAKTRFHTAKRDRFCPPEDVLSELREVLDEIALPDWITFSGTGEPTLNIDLGHIIRELKTFCQAPVCVITNSSLLYMPEVRNELMLADRILPTLTSVNPDTFSRIHRPVAELKLTEILEGLKEFAKVFSGTIEIEIFVVPGMNDSEEEISGLREFILSLARVDSIYLNTAVRMPLDHEVITADHEKLERFREQLAVKIPVTTAFERNLDPAKPAQWQRANAENEIIKLLLRHPCNEKQLEQMLSIEPERLTQLLQLLEGQQKIRQQKNGEWKLAED